MNRRHALGTLAACCLPPVVAAAPADPALTPAPLPADLQALLARDADAIDIAAAAHLLGRLDPASAAGLADQERFTLVVQGAGQRLSVVAPGSPRAALTALHHYLFHELGLRWSPAAAPSPDPVRALLTSRRGDVQALATLHLAVSQRLGLPVHGASAPGHRLLRLTLPGQAPQNIELTLAGAALTDAQYIDRFALAPRSIANGAYLRTLDHREFLATMLLPAATHLRRQGQAGTALALMEAAVRLNPRDPDGVQALARFWMDASRAARGHGAGGLSAQREARAGVYQRHAQALGWVPGPSA